MFSLQDILRYLGIAAAVVAVILAALAVRTYLVLDIRAVMDDLAGRSKRTPSRGGSRRGLRRSRPTNSGASHAAEPSDVANRPIDTAMQEDQIATLVEDGMSLPHVVPVSATSYTMVLDEDDLPTMVAGWSDDTTPTVLREDEETGREAPVATMSPTETTNRATTSFVLTKRLVTLHSSSIISIE